jgi:hypothetical protein
MRDLKNIFRIVLASSISQIKTAFLIWSCQFKIWKHGFSDITHDEMSTDQLLVFSQNSAVSYVQHQTMHFKVAHIHVATTSV